MMLSELYGRIGQVLREHGDAPIAKFKTPKHTSPPYLKSDFYNNEHVEVSFSTLQIPVCENRYETLKSYVILIESQI